MKTKARSCAKNHGIKVLMGEMTDIPTGTTAAKKKERFELCLELYGRNIKNDMYQTNNAGVKTLTEHGELMLRTAFDDLLEWCYKLIEAYTYSNSSSFVKSHAHSICKQHQLKDNDERMKLIWTDLDNTVGPVPRNPSCPCW